ncbi:MAG: hypothetical protein ABL931_14690 [Usitatibacteraceae bacterium]
MRFLISKFGALMLALMTSCVVVPVQEVVVLPGKVASPSYLSQLKAAEEAVAALEGAASSTVDVTGKQTAVRKLSLALDVLAVVRSQTGDIVGATSALSTLKALRGAQRVAEYSQLLDGTIPMNAINAIVAEARERQIVILNEAHHDPVHRAFATRLATELRKFGFEYLACETFGPDVAHLNSESIERRMGYYTADPVFSEFVRQAKRIGYALVPYEHIASDAKLSQQEKWAAREDGQAQKIIAATLAKNPNAKIFVYVGFGHVKKADSNPTATEQMAARLWKRTGINPLTIDQTTMTAQPAAHPQFEIYEKVLRKHEPLVPIVLRAAQGGYAVFGSYYSGSVDMQVIFPNYATQFGRPTWFVSLANRTPFETPRTMLPTRGRRLIQAFHKMDGAVNVPADMVMAEAGKEPPMLMLPKGDFRFAYED